MGDSYHQFFRHRLDNPHRLSFRNDGDLVNGAGYQLIEVTDRDTRACPAVTSEYLFKQFLYANRCSVQIA
jgi:hypothetical protein